MTKKRDEKKIKGNGHLLMQFRSRLLVHCVTEDVLTFFLLNTFLSVVTFQLAERS